MPDVGLAATTEGVEPLTNRAMTWSTATAGTSTARWSEAANELEALETLLAMDGGRGQAAHRRRSARPPRRPRRSRRPRHPPPPRRRPPRIHKASAKGRPALRSPRHAPTRSACAPTAASRSSPRPGSAGPASTATARAKITVALVGDSHAAQWFPALRGRGAAATTGGSSLHQDCLSVPGHAREQRRPQARVLGVHGVPYPDDRPAPRSSSPTWSA